MTRLFGRFVVLSLCICSASPASEAVTLTEAKSAMVRFARADITLGSTRDEVLSAAELCNRDARDEVCTPETFAGELFGPRVLVESFWLDRREVSYREYSRCVDAGRCGPPDYAGAHRLEQDDLPVVFVTHEDASRFCAFRGARLPTEAELERAQRGTTRRVFPWGARFNGGAANHGRTGMATSDDSDGYDELAPVQSFPAGHSPEGIENLSGNVAEWTSSRFAPYADPGATGSNFVVRGGHYLQAAAWLRGAARSHEPASRRAAYLGFRCARSAEHDGRDSTSPRKP
jgi:formylglycine-generating enzyme required for sulfatase activity